MTIAQPTSLGGYELLHRIGSGGMGEVYLAAASAAGTGRRQPVALKRLLQTLADDASMQLRFADEARLASRLSHPRLVRALDVSRAQRDRFFTMEFVDGRTLADLVRASHRVNHQIPVAATIELVQGVAAALDYVHELADTDGRPLGIVHCDLSPTNIMVTHEGLVRLIDFGIARGRHASAPVLHEGQLLGTLAYMSPEQCRGEPVDRRSDVFALGILLWELTMHTRLFRGARDEVASWVSGGLVPIPRELRPDYPQELEALVLHALRADPRGRPGSAGELAISLATFARRHGISAEPAALATWAAALDP